MNGKEKRETMKDILNELLPDAIKGHLDPLSGKIESLGKSLEKFLKKGKTEKTENEESQKSGDAKNENTEENADDSRISKLEKGMEDILGLLKGMTKKDETSSKSKDSEEEDEEDSSKKGINDDRSEDEGDEGEIEKCFSNSTDSKKAMAFMKYALDNEEVYDSLKSSEKDKIKSLYFKASAAGLV